MKTRTILGTAISVFASWMISSAEAQFSPWLTEPGKLDTNVSQTYQTFKDFWLGNDHVTAPFGRINQYTTSVGWDYGIRDGLSVGGSVGYTWTKPRSDDLQDEGGLDDSYLGVRNTLSQEGENWYEPVVSLKVDAIIQGTYDTGFVSSPGDGGSGIQTVLGLGKNFGESGVGVVGNVGYRARSHGVPPDMLYYASVFKTFDQHYTVAAAYRLQQGLSGRDINDSDFTPDSFPELKERSGNMEFSFGYTADSGYSVFLVYANTINGRNTADNQVVGLNFGIPFNLQ